MSDFSTQVSVNAPADDVFAFVTDFSHMHEFIPTVTQVMPAGDGRIRLLGEEEGRPYEAAGWYQIHEFNRTMLWGSESSTEYSGDLEVVDMGETSLLEFNLKFLAGPDMSPEARETLDSRKYEIQRALEDSAHKVKVICERAYAKQDKYQKGYVS